MSPAEADAALGQAQAAGIHLMAVPTPFLVGRVNCYLIEDDPLTLVDTGPNSGKSLDELERALAELGHSRILVEGGPTLLAQLSAAGLLDELCWSVSPLIEGGGAARMTVSKSAEQPVPRDFALRVLLEDDGFLLASYVRR